MFDIKWEHPLLMGNASFMALSWQMAAAKTVHDANMRKYFPYTYHMMRAWGVN